MWQCVLQRQRIGGKHVCFGEGKDLRVFRLGELGGVVVSEFVEPGKPLQRRACTCSCAWSLQGEAPPFHLKLFSFRLFYRELP